MPNRLQDETSPYLLQHADNPVDWYPWSEPAFDIARAENKPVLLSIGYSACHWCHVMAHESFEDETTAALMNEHFVNIKVDREERPDLDKIYQLAHQLLTRRGGGWPLTMFLDPETRRPFFGGTYFPDEARYGMPGFAEVLQSVAAYHRERREELHEQGEQLAKFMETLGPEPAPAGEPLTAGPIDGARDALGRAFDRDYGGFGSAPKFPHPPNIERLLRHWRGTANSDEPDLDALYMATLSLTRMADGGIYDHLGGGFCRYSVDRYWQIPHFEKMLYDNGPLLALYVQSWLATGDEKFRRVARETAGWMLADMQAPNGGLYSTRDADSEGEEGKYYVWTPGEVASALDDDEYAVFSARFGLDGPPNFEGNWHLTVHEAIEAVATTSGRPTEEVVGLLDGARAKLLTLRGERVPPARDEKQLTAWNALAIRGLAIAGRALGDDLLTGAAEDAVAFIRRDLFADGRLRAVYKDGRARFPGYLDDYAFLLDAILELLQAQWSTANLEFSIELADSLLEHFEDESAGGFWFTANDHETLMHRPKPLADDATPSGNGIAALALQRLGFLLGETRYLDAAERTLRAAWKAMEEYPHGHVTLINALEEYLSHPEIVILRGETGEIERWRDAAAQLYAPRRLVFAIPGDATDLPGALADRRPVAGEAVAYRCVGTHCELPVTSWEALAAQLTGI